ncbi:MAG: glutamine-hydrolyzing carbamoyl-phosphate synthase small subunit [Acidimicrobiia bacterium]
MTPGHLVLADGTVFAGLSVGAAGAAVGEVVFNTSMTGYQEISTDPSYAQQIVVMTAPHVGNYGTNDADEQGADPVCAGFVMRAATGGSSWRSTGDFLPYLAERGVVALSDVDTRRLTRHIRARGAMPAALGGGVPVAELEVMAAGALGMEGRDLASHVTTPVPYVAAAAGGSGSRVVAYDFGIKRDIIGALTMRGCQVHIVPASWTAEQVLELEPDGVFLSNGPGDPGPLGGAVTAVRGLLGEVPLFGVCLGHQVLGLALGAATFKLPFGHHGGNHPVRSLSDGTVAITSQNHGFAVDLWSLCGEKPPERTGVPGPELLPARVDSAFGKVIPTHQNLNDGTLEGLACSDVDAFSVQYHPEAAPGPRDAERLFDRFVDRIGAG